MTYPLLFQLLKRLAGKVSSGEVILVGGQALAILEKKFLPGHAGPPVMTADVDFLGGIEDALDAAELLGVEIKTPSIDDHTPNTGSLVFGGEIVDFLDQIEGLDFGDVRRTAIKVSIKAVEDTLVVSVMNPILLMESRFHNIYRFSSKRGEHHIHQARVSVSVSRAFLERLLEIGETRAALDFAERIISFSVTDRSRSAFHLYGLDTLLAIPSDGMPRAFKEKRWPQAVQQIEERRNAWARLMERRQSLSKKGAGGPEAS